jgi:hypothetical protein
MLGLRQGHSHDFHVGRAKVVDKMNPTRGLPTTGDIHVKLRPVSLLGLLLGLTQGQMKKLEERQGQIENSGRGPHFDNPSGYNDLVF